MLFRPTLHIVGAWGDCFLPVAKFFVFRRAPSIKCTAFGMIRDLGLSENEEKRSDTRVNYQFS